MPSIAPRILHPLKRCASVITKEIRPRRRKVVSKRDDRDGHSADATPKILRLQTRSSLEQLDESSVMRSGQTEQVGASIVHDEAVFACGSAHTRYYSLAVSIWRHIFGTQQVDCRNIVLGNRAISCKEH